jgi:protein tyrosine/serine phosphatase
VAQPLLSGCTNARDLGGLPTRDGRRIRRRALIRTDSLAHLDTAGRAAMERLEPGLILDLRSAPELVADPNPFAGHPAFRHRPFFDPGWEAVRDDLTQTTRRGIYRRMLGGNLGAIGAAIREIAAAPPGRPIVAHCAGGKDRTGLIVALLLDVAGVPRDRIAADWAASEEGLGVPAMLAAFEGTAEERRAMELGWSTPPEAMFATFADLDDGYGGSRGFLRECGVDDATMDELVERLVE